MQLRWTEEAATDLEHIAGYLLTHTPSRAQGLIRAVYAAPSDLLTFPNRGRRGKKEGTRELVLSPLPYIVVYKVLGDIIFVVYCTARRNGHSAVGHSPGAAPRSRYRSGSRR